MKKLLVTLAAVLVSVSAFAQGTVTLNNRTSTGDAKIFMPDGVTGPGQNGGMAQLYLSSGGTLTALTPSTPFRSSSAAASVFVTPIDVTVPGIAAGSPATFVLRAWVGAGSYEAAATRGESAPVSVSALGGVPPGGGAPITTPDLAGLQGFNLVVPEPSTIALGVLGAAALFIRRRK